MIINLTYDFFKAREGVQEITIRISKGYDQREQIKALGYKWDGNTWVKIVSTSSIDTLKADAGAAVSAAVTIGGTLDTDTLTTTVVKALHRLPLQDGRGA